MRLGKMWLAGAVLGAAGGLAYGCAVSDSTFDDAAGQGGTAAGIGGGGGAGGGGGFEIDAGDDAQFDFDSSTDGCADGEECDCYSVEFSIDTMQSCAMSILPGFEMDGEGFIQLGGTDHRVFAMDRWGTGHVVAWCDGTTLPQLLEAFNVAGYLGQVPSPRVASFGDAYLCQPGGIPSNPVPDWVEYQGLQLPVQYQGDPAGLAADWDVIILCGFRRSWTYNWADDIGSFVADHGKGFLAVMEYESLANDDDFTSMSLITSQDGIVFEPLNLEWAPASAEVTLDCVPDVPPPE